MRLGRYLDFASEYSQYYAARICGRSIINFLHVGKTGGTCVKAALKSGHAHTPDRIRFRLLPHRTRLSDIPRGEKVFFFLREPASRFVSGFNSRQRQGRPRYDFPWSPAERIAFSRFQSAEDLAASLSSADRQVRDAAEDAMRAIQHVRESFYYWFISDDYLASRLDDIILIGFQETLEADFDRLKRLVGLPEDLALPGDEVAAHCSPTTQEAPLSAEAKANLSRWYAMDRRFYALCKQIAATQLRETSGAETAPGGVLA